MQIRHLEQEIGYRPGKLIQGWHRQNSGELSMTDTIKAQRGNTERPLTIYEQPTVVEMPAIAATLRDLSTKKIEAQLLMPQIKSTTMSSKHLSCFEIRDSQRNTLELIEDAIYVCIRETGLYPYCIVLEPLRYLSMITYINAAGGYYFIKNTDIRIPYAYAKELANYDVMAVCEV